MIQQVLELKSYSSWDNRAFTIPSRHEILHLWRKLRLLQLIKARIGFSQFPGFHHTVLVISPLRYDLNRQLLELLFCHGPLLSVDNLKERNRSTTACGEVLELGS